MSERVRRILILAEENALREGRDAVQVRDVFVGMVREGDNPVAAWFIRQFADPIAALESEVPR